MINYRVRLAELGDLARCVEIDASYITTYVWQVQEGFDEPETEPVEPVGRVRPRIMGKTEGGGPPTFRLELSPSRLPRPLAIPAPLNDQELLAEWKKTDHLLIAETVEAEPDPDSLEKEEGEVMPLLAPDPARQPDILGYLGLRVDGARHIAWITTGAVQLDYRRQGIGGQLLAEAQRWADRYRLRSLMIELATKNYPAISFLQKQGFFLCGYNSAYYPTREIALFFGRRLEKFN